MHFFSSYRRQVDFDTANPVENMPVAYPLAAYSANWAKGIPVRLSPTERKTMRLLKGIVKTMSYTDRVDTSTLIESVSKRKQIQTSEIFNFCLSLLIGSEFEQGMELSENPSKLKAHEKKICHLVERLRRYKILNPDKLRTDYAKLLFMLQDSVEENVSSGLSGISLIKNLKTVHDLCDRHGILDLLDEEALSVCITPVPRISNRDSLNTALRYKNQVLREVVRKFTSRGVPEGDVELVIYSLSDIKQFDVENTEPIRKLLKIVKQSFSPFQVECDELDLGIFANLENARLTHSHEEQFFFFVQTLTFWKNILEAFHGIWGIAEDEMLDPSNAYTLRDSGQGIHRIQQKCGRTFREIQLILDQTISEVTNEQYFTDSSSQRRTGKWIGSKKIHIGDEQVPNGLFFLDKYTQICKILNPIVRVIEYIQSDNKFIQEFVLTKWESPKHVIRVILADFIRQGFDGSGGDTWDEAGSCIDGRLTSTWNWCNDIASKEFYPIFRLAGFSSFEGELEE